MDDDEIEDLLSLPMAKNIYWDPFEKCLRIDPLLGKVFLTLYERYVTCDDLIFPGACGAEHLYRGIHLQDCSNQVRSYQKGHSTVFVTV